MTEMKHTPEPTTQDLQEAHIEALKAENARLREALMRIDSELHGTIPITAMVKDMVREALKGGDNAGA